MLDENLPTFYLNPFSKESHVSTLHLSQHGSDAEPTYTLRRPDPSLATSKNCYAVALFDSYNPDILYGEVLIRPAWTQPSPTGETRRNGTGSPVPEPIIPTEFVIQLYAPDQQVVVRQKQGSWGTSAYWEFELPQRTFRQPSTSALDRSQIDPAASDITPKLSFRWKKDGKLSKDLICQLSGRSSDPVSGKKSKEPDIAIALFRHLREMTVYEPNLSRVEMEDPKGLEVVMLLSAAVVRDVYFGNARETFNVLPPASRRESDANKASSPIASGMPNKITVHHQPPPALSPLQHQTSPVQPSGPRYSPTAKPHSPAEIDKETARLKAQLEAEERAKAKMDEAEAKRIKKMLDAEEKEARRRQAAIDKETERLRRKYGEEEKKAVAAAAAATTRPSRPQVPYIHGHSTPSTSYPRQQQHHSNHSTGPTLWPQPSSSSSSSHMPPRQPQQQHQQRQLQLIPQSSRLHLPQTSGASFLGGSHVSPARPGQRPALAVPIVAAAAPKQKKSMFGLRSRNDEMGRKGLDRKRSSMF